MKPKEKAKELYDKYHKLLSSITRFSIHSESKQSAIMAVDEILQTLNRDIRDIDVAGNILLDLIEYWREVKQEIINI